MKLVAIWNLQTFKKIKERSKNKSLNRDMILLLIK